MRMSMMERVAEATAIVPTISLEEAAAIMDQKNVLVVDGRSALAGKALLDLGYRDVRNLGGFNAWRESGRPVE